jgi:hypothetical protein
MGAGVLNKYGTALLLGAASGAFYVFLAGTFDLLKTLTLSSAVFGVVLLAALARDLCRRPSNLGDLQEERPTLIGALMFTAIFSSYQIYELVMSLPTAAPPKLERLWIDASWGPSGDCENALKLKADVDKMLLNVEVGGELHSRQLLAAPTKDEVMTEGGLFRLQSDGSMTSTVGGYKDSRFTRCDR